MKILITGASGFVGSYLAEALLAKHGLSAEIVGVASSQMSINRLPHLAEKIDWRVGNLLDERFVESIISDYDQVYHLAAFSSAGNSFSKPVETIENNLKAELFLLEGLKKTESKARILIVGSIDMYGSIEGDADVVEDTPLMPASPYAVSKIAQDYLGLHYYLSHNLDVVRVRPSNHIGPRQAAGFVVPSFCQQVASIELGKQEPEIKVGTISTIRDFTDVRDMVVAYMLALDKGQAGEAYVLGSGVGTSIEDVLNEIISQSTVKPIKITVDPTKIRAKDVSRLVVKADKFIQLTSWHTTIPLSTSLHAILDFWRNTSKE